MRSVVPEEEKLQGVGSKSKEFELGEEKAEPHFEVEKVQKEVTCPQELEGSNEFELGKDFTEPGCKV